MLTASLVALLMAFATGLVLVMLALRKQRSSLLLALGHAALALLGVGLLINAIVQSAESNRHHNLAALLLVMALLGGAVLLALRISKRDYRSPAPLFVVVMHASFGVAAILTLASGYFGS